MDIDYEEFKCPICKFKFDEEAHLPRLLIKCGHTLCTSCIQSQLIEKNKTIICPEDSMLYENITNAEEMPTNHYLLKLLKKQSHSFIPYKESSSPLMTPKQSSNNYIRKSTTIRTSLKRAPKQNICADHSQPLTIICLEHKEKICAQCVLKNEHKDHTVITDEEFMNQIDSLIDLFQEVDMNIITYSMDEALTSQDSLEKIQNKINGIIETYHQRQKEMIAYVTKCCDDSINKLELRKSELIEKYSNCQVDIKDLNRSSKEWLDIVQNKLDVLNEITEPLSECVKLIDEDQSKNQLALINSGKSLINKYFSIQKVNEMIKELDSYPNCLIESKDNEEVKIAFNSIVIDLFAIREDQSVITKLNLKPVFEGIQSTPMTNKINSALFGLNSISSIKLNNNDIPIDLISKSSCGSAEITSDNSLQGLINTTNIKTTFGLKNTHPKSNCSVNERELNNLNSNNGTLINGSSNNNKILQPKANTPRTKTPNKDKIVFIKTQLKNEIANFSRIDIGDEGIKLICSQLECKSLIKVKELKLVKSNLTDDSVIYLFKVLENINTLTSINISNNNLTDKIGEATIAFLNKSSNLKTFNLNNNMLSLVMKEKIKSYSSSSKVGGSLKIFI